MTIPLAQLTTWSGQGAIQTSKDTYATVKVALEDAKAKYTDRNFKVFLQGSYGNDTNIWAESDVDVVIRYDGAFFHDIKVRPLGAGLDGFSKNGHQPFARSALRFSAELQPSARVRSNCGLITLLSGIRSQRLILNRRLILASGVFASFTAQST